MKSFNNILVNENSSIKETLKVIDEGDIRMAFVTNSQNKLIGIISDGDIRRSLINQHNLDDSIQNIIQKDFIYAKVGTPKERIIQLARHNQIYEIPIVDENFIMQGVEDVNELISKKKHTNKVILMVGGLGKRLRPLTNDTPKPMLRIGGRPILETIIQNFIKYGFYDFILCVNYKSDIIKEYFKDGRQFGAHIKYLEEDKELGTAGALSLLSKDEFSENFFVMNGDLLTTMNFEHLLEFHINNNSKATMTTREFEIEIPYGVIKTEQNNITNIIEKPKEKYFVNSGIYMLHPSVLEYVPKNTFFDMPSLFEHLIQDKKNVLSFPTTEYWLDIGEKSTFDQANLEYLNIFGN